MKSVDADEQVQLAFRGLHLRDIDVKEADGVAFEALSLWLVTVDVRQAGSAVPLEATMQRCARQVPSSRLSVANEACDRCIAARTACVSWRSRDVPLPYGFLPFQRKDRTIKPWDQTPTNRDYNAD